MQQISASERRNRATMVAAAGLVALFLLTAWAVILRRAPIEDNLTARAAAELERIGVEPGSLSFEGRDGSATVDAALAGAAESAVRSLTGVRTVTITQVTAPTTTTTTTTVPPATTTTSSTTTTAAPPEAAFTLTSGGDGVTLSGRLTPADAGAVVAAAEAAFGADRVIDAITTDPDTTRPAWVAGLPGSLASLAFVADPGLAITSGVITLAGDIASEERRIAVLTAFSSLGLEIGDGLSIAAPPGAAEAAALEQALNAALDDASILFDTGSSTLSEAGGDQLDAIAELLIVVPGARVEVGGHTDNEGPADGNQILSQARADSIVAYLIDRGVDPVQLTAVGYGEDQPIADNTTPEGRAANRRIAFIVEGSA
ncbi:MAG: OmpA family protein [Acidimicrobiia bacterium]|nr:OmpA family protein [Acidimicrobiia bacterium]